jgi:hypothetical protein
MHALLHMHCLSCLVIYCDVIRTCRLRRVQLLRLWGVREQLQSRQVSPYFLVLLKVLSLVAFLVEDACVGVFMDSCLTLLDFMLRFCLALSSFASPSRTATTIGLCFTLVVGRVNTYFWLSVENLVLQKLRKQLS